MKLYDFPRSSASYRVRIAANLKGIEFEPQLVDFGKDEQTSTRYLSVAASGLVPAIEFDGNVLTQSIAIIRYLDCVCPDPLLVPDDPIVGSVVLEMALSVACDIHPINNLRVLKRLKNRFGASEDAIRHDWYAHWVRLGFLGLEARAAVCGGRCCYGDTVTLADVCLVPQMFNARRFNVDLREFPTLTAIADRLEQEPAFAKAAPNQQHYGADTTV